MQKPKTLLKELKKTKGSIHKLVNLENNKSKEAKKKKATNNTFEP